MAAIRFTHEQLILRDLRDTEQPRFDQNKTIVIPFALNNHEHSSFLLPSFGIFNSSKYDLNTLWYRAYISAWYEILGRDYVCSDIIKSYVRIDEPRGIILLYITFKEHSQEFFDKQFNKLVKSNREYLQLSVDFGGDDEADEPEDNNGDDKDDEKKPKRQKTLTKREMRTQKQTKDAANLLHFNGENFPAAYLNKLEFSYETHNWFRFIHRKRKQDFAGIFLSVLNSVGITDAYFVQKSAGAADPLDALNLDLEIQDTATRCDPAYGKDVLMKGTTRITCALKEVFDPNSAIWQAAGFPSLAQTERSAIRVVHHSQTALAHLHRHAMPFKELPEWRRWSALIGCSMTEANERPSHLLAFIKFSKEQFANGNPNRARMADAFFSLILTDREIPTAFARGAREFMAAERQGREPWRGGEINLYGNLTYSQNAHLFMLRFFEQKLNIFRFHQLLMMVVLVMMGVAYRADEESMQLPHSAQLGVRGTGKSHVVDKAKKYVFPESFLLNKTHESQMNRFVETPYNDTSDHRCDMFDELDPAIVNAEGVKQGLESKSGQMIKQRMTVEVATSIVLTIDADGKRQQSEFNAQVNHSPLMGSTNTDFANADPATVSRLVQSPFLPMNRVGDLQQDTTNKTILKRITFLSIVLSAMQKAGIVEFADMSGLPCFLKRLKERLRENPFVFTSYDDAFDRKAGTMASLLSAHMNLTAVLNVFLSPESDQDFKPSQFLECNKYLVPSERDFVLVASHMRNDFCSDIIMSVARCFAASVKKSCKSDTPSEVDEVIARDEKAKMGGLCPWNTEGFVKDGLKKLNAVEDNTSDNFDDVMKCAQADGWGPYVPVVAVAGGGEKMAAAEQFLFEKMARKLKAQSPWIETDGMGDGWIVNVFRKLQSHNVFDDYYLTGTKTLDCLKTPHPAVRIDFKISSSGQGNMATLFVSRCLLNETVLQRNTFMRTMERAVVSAGNCEAGVYITAEPLSLEFNSSRKPAGEDMRYLANHVKRVVKPVIPFLCQSFTVGDHRESCDFHVKDAEDDFVYEGRDDGCTCFRKNPVGMVGKTAVSTMPSVDYVMLQKLERQEKVFDADKLQTEVCHSGDARYPEAAVAEVVKRLKNPSEGEKIAPDARQKLVNFRKRARGIQD